MSSSTTAKPSMKSRLRLISVLASAALTVVAASVGAPIAANAVPVSTITLNTNTVTPYGWVTITSASGFGPNDRLSITLDGTDVTGQFNNITTDANGDITTPLGSMQIPGPNGGTVGQHTFIVYDPSSVPVVDSARATVQVVPAPSPNPATAQRTVSQMKSTGVTIVFSGFTAGDSGTFTMVDPTHVGRCGGTVTADASGNMTVVCVWNAAFSPSFATWGPGQYTINGGNYSGTMQSGSAFVTVVADPTAPAPVTPVSAPPVTAPVAAPPAAPAVPVTGSAQFTG